jgi:type II secretory pathway pseudopilin PulG
MRTSFVALAALAIGSASAAAQSQTSSGPVDLTEARKALRSILVAQETYFSNNNHYSPDLGALNLALGDSIVVKFVESRPNGWSGQATIKGKPNASCVIMVGNITTIPATVQGRAAKAEGAALCDGDPS